MVEMRGVEPLSENPSSWLSTSVADIFFLPLREPVGRLTFGQFRYA